MQRIYAIYFFLLWVILLTAQGNPQPHFRNYGTEQGLPSPEVHCAFEDSHGYMWFGTDNGVARFDGYDFKTYGAEEGLMSNVVFDVHEDGKGRIWFGTMTGEIFILEGDTILPYRFNYLIEGLRDKFRGAGFMHLSKDETTYSILKGLGIAIIDSTGNLDTLTNIFSSSTIVYHEDEFEETLMTNSHRLSWKSLFTDSEILKQEHFFIVDIRNKGERHILEIPRFDAQGKSGESKMLNSGEFLIQKGGHLFCILDGEVIWYIPYQERIASIIEDSINSSIWFCLGYGKGLRNYKDLNSIKKSSFFQYLEGMSITKTLRSLNGDIWVSTIEHGVLFLSNVGIESYGKSFGLTTENIHSVTFKNDEILFAGGENGDIFQVDIKSNNLISTHSNQLGRHNFSLLYDEGKVWYGGVYQDMKGIKGGIKYWHIGQKKMVLFNAMGMDNLQINNDGHLLATHNSLGLKIFDIEKEILIYDVLNRNNSGRVYGLHSDFSNRLWVGTKDGLHEFIDSTYVHVGIDHPAFHHRVEDIHQFQDSTLVFGTKGFGIMVWKEGEEPLQITKKDGLTSNMLEDVHVCENNILWVGTLNGLNKITFEEGKSKVRRFTMSNGLPSNEIYQIKSYEGQVWLCTSNGLVKFQDKPVNEDAPAPVLQNIRVNNATFSPKEIVDLAHDENNLTFEFLTINYRQNGQIPYRYRLAKKDPWQYTQNRTVNYSKLSKGQYTFEVQAQNEDGFWSESTLKKVQILPPWWETWWFRLAVVSLTGLVTWRIYQYRLAQIQKETDLKNQMIELEKSALQAQMNPHFIFNCLNSIQNFILKNEKKQAVEFLARFARLVRHNLNASVEGKVTLEEEISLLDNYLALERERFDQGFDYQITVDDNLNAAFVEFPPLLIQPYVENAVIHGISQKVEKGKVEIKFYRARNELVVEVNDNGVGYRKAKNGKLSNKLRHKSVGMSITKKRLEILNEGGTPDIFSVFNNSGDQSGTSVRLKIGLSNIQKTLKTN